MIINKSKLSAQFSHGKILLDIAEQVLTCIQPDRLLEEAVTYKKGILTIQGKSFQLDRYKHVYVVGAGKATMQLAIGINVLLGKRITGGHIAVPDTSSHSVPSRIGSITVTQAGHPFPNQAGLQGAKRIMQYCTQATKDDLVISLITGGGSSLMPLPIPGVTLTEKVALTKQLMNASADIYELNAVRKHLSAIKGGKLAAACAPATMINLIISDVIEDKLDIIASGPTVADSSTSAEALEILRRYKCGSAKLRKAIEQHETPKQLNSKLVHNFLIGNNQVALNEITKHAKRAGLHTIQLSSCLRGEAKEVAQVLMSIAKEVDAYNRPIRKPALLIAGGETTVTVLGKGHGGRNQELVLAAVPLMNSRMSMLSLATDGVDGVTPTPVAGALADGAVAQQCVIKGINYHDYLYSNDSFNCLKQLGCLLYTGPTGTNVGDIVMVLIR